jgi:hypothetical protein
MIERLIAEQEARVAELVNQLKLEKKRLRKLKAVAELPTQS